MKSYDLATRPDPSDTVWPLNRLCKLVDELEVIDEYFSNDLLDQYERTLEQEVGETEFDILPMRHIVRPGDSVLEVGSGMGRMIVDLAVHTAARELTGIELSEPATRRAIARRDAAGVPPNRCRLICGNVLEVLSDKDIFDTIVLPDMTIGHFLSTGDVEALLRCLLSHLSKRGRIAFALFDDESIPGVARTLNGRHTVDRFIDRGGVPHLIWWAMQFDEPNILLHRSAFIETASRAAGRLNGLLANTYQRWWTPASLANVFAALGLREERRYEGKVDGGAVKAEKTLTLVVSPQPQAEAPRREPADVEER
jgi:SAM-dependent methyltransferase